MDELRRLELVVLLALTAVGCDGDCLSRTELYRCSCSPPSPSSPLHCATSASQAVNLAESTCRMTNCTCTWEADDCDPNRNERCPR